jgi:hypothetical protein
VFWTGLLLVWGGAEVERVRAANPGSAPQRSYAFPPLAVRAPRCSAAENESGSRPRQRKVFTLPVSKKRERVPADSFGRRSQEATSDEPRRDSTSTDSEGLC